VQSLNGEILESGEREEESGSREDRDAGRILKWEMGRGRSVKVESFVQSLAQNADIRSCVVIRSDQD